MLIRQHVLTTTVYQIKDPACTGTVFTTLGAAVMLDKAKDGVVYAI